MGPEPTRSPSPNGLGWSFTTKGWARGTWRIEDCRDNDQPFADVAGDLAEHPDRIEGCGSMYEVLALTK